MADTAAGLVRPFLPDKSIGPFSSDLTACTGLVAGDVLLLRGDTDAALARYRESYERFTKNAALFPDQDGARESLGWVHTRLGSAHARRGDSNLARREWQAAVDVLLPWVAAGSSGILDAYVRPLLALGRFDEARPLCRKLRERTWDYQGLQQLCRGKGLLEPASIVPAAN
jgi:tetratricopeptide (TPR) repeat protein